MTHGRRRLGQEWLAVDGGEARTTFERSPWLAGDSQKKLHMILLQYYGSITILIQESIYC